MCYKKNVIYAVILLGGVWQAFAGNNLVKILPKNIAVEVTHPETKDFSLAVTNSTAKTIVFRNCNFDCKCLEIISYSKNNAKCDAVNVNLEPKDILKVKFKINSKFYTNKKVLPVYFFFNNLLPAVQIVKVIADIKSDVIPKPENMAAIVPQGFKGKIGSFALKLQNNNVKIGDIKANTDFINAKYNPENKTIDVFLNKPADINTDAWLNVSLSQISHTDYKSQTTDHGPRASNLRKKQKRSSQRKLLLHIREIKTIPDLYITPASIDFGIISKPGEITGKEIVIKSRTDTPWKILGSQIKGKNKNAVKRKILPQTNSAVNVLWTILDGKISPGLINTEIIINTDHPYSKQIVIPVNGQVLSPKNESKNIKNFKKVKK